MFVRKYLKNVSNTFYLLNGNDSLNPLLEVISDPDKTKNGLLDRVPFFLLRNLLGYAKILPLLALALISEIKSPYISWPLTIVLGAPLFLTFLALGLVQAGIQLAKTVLAAAVTFAAALTVLPFLAWLGYPSKSRVSSYVERDNSEYHDPRNFERVHASNIRSNALGAESTCGVPQGKTLEFGQSSFLNKQSDDGCVSGLVSKSNNNNV